jgi:hypothetical protein
MGLPGNVVPYAAFNLKTSLRRNWLFLYTYFYVRFLFEVVNNYYIGSPPHAAS